MKRLIYIFNVIIALFTVSCVREDFTQPIPENVPEGYQKIADELSKLEKEKKLLINKKVEAQNALNILRENKEPLTEFDEAIFFSLVENIVVKSKDTLVFNFKDGTEIEWKI